MADASDPRAKAREIAQRLLTESTDADVRLLATVYLDIDTIVGAVGATRPNFAEITKALRHGRGSE